MTERPTREACADGSGREPYAAHVGGWAHPALYVPANARYRETRGPDMSGPYCAFLNKIKTKGELHG